MIYISTACSNIKSIPECIDEITSWGFDKIELTGGFSRKSYLDFVDKYEQSHISFRCHNYFPPPENPFVLNLSLKGDQILSSLNLINESIKFSEKIGAEKYAVHAGFRISPKVEELGNQISRQKLMPHQRAEQNMIENFNAISLLSEKVRLYLENNVFSQANHISYEGENPFLLCSFSDYQQLSKKFKFKVLLDVAHLKVTCNSLNLDFEENLASFLSVSDYIHISDNNGLADQNLELTKNSELFSLLNKYSNLLKNKTYTIEVYNGEEAVLETVKNLKLLLKLPIKE
jgi:sugar phosphate isomerase/epimerase